ncbi:DUF300-domain-containing protein [Violaceomyces palustris]|uniref:DUF300-domain-containing protein n=1 Tax=Violaceomyces palustris TaxID=1673888 RepID=A0ACD0NVC9_9BASI|nr:DUF300-domain-containing protein [Violaceomyces palustris]
MDSILPLEQQPPEGNGSGRSLPSALLVVSSLSALFATAFSFFLIWTHLKNYRKPTLQRYVVRLLVMVPIYSIASVISLFSLDLAYVIDLVRDLYEAFVIYCFFNLLIEYLGGERSLIILLHGRRPTPHLFPVNLFMHPMDASDPYTFLALKRGVLQYVQIKPVLAILTVVLKSVGKYGDGRLSFSNGYTYVSLTYNISVFLSLYCLGMFWACLNEDLKPFRVTSKFLCIKGIIFFSFWQGLAISILVAAGLIKRIGPVADEAYISLAVQDMLICLEMPIFALAHAYAFSHKDYIDPFAHYAARLPVYYALRDCIGMYDVFSDSLTTVRGTGYGYQTFEPSEGVVHQSLARERRSKAGLRYAEGGKAKYWLPQRGSGDIRNTSNGARHQGPISTFRRYIDRKRMQHEAFAPLLPEHAADVIHTDPDLDRDLDEEGQPSRSLPAKALARAEAGLHFFSERPPESDEDAWSLHFDSPASDEEILYDSSRKLHHGDYAYPNVDVTREQSRRARWAEDDEIVHRKRKKSLSHANGKASGTGQGTAADGVTGSTTLENSSKKSKGKEKSKGKGKGKDKDKGRRGQERGGKGDEKDDEGAGKGKGGDMAKKRSTWASWAEPEEDARPKTPEREERRDREEASMGDEPLGSPNSSAKIDPYGAVDLVVEDFKAEERERLLERRRGDPALRAGRSPRIFRKQYDEGSEAPRQSPSSLRTDTSQPRQSPSSQRTDARASLAVTSADPPGALKRNEEPDRRIKGEGKVATKVGREGEEEEEVETRMGGRAAGDQPRGGGGEEEEKERKGEEIIASEVAASQEALPVSTNVGPGPWYERGGLLTRQEGEGNWTIAGRGSFDDDPTYRYGHRRGSSSFDGNPWE